MFADQMREHFCVRVRFKLMVGANQFLFQRVVVFNDAVVDDGDFAGRVEVRMTVGVRRNAVCGPARVGDAEAAGGGFGFQHARDTFVNFAFFLTQ